MGIVSNKLLLEKGLRADFMKKFNNGENPQEIMGMIMETDSSADSEKYGWLGNSPQMTEWLDERKLKGLKDFDYSIANKDYEATLKVNKNAMDDDQLGAVKVRISDLASVARNHPRKLFFDQLKAGEVDLGYDGLPFFSLAHDESGVNQLNLATATIAGTSQTVAEFKAEFQTARQGLRVLTDDQGEPRNEGNMDLIVVCSPDLQNVVDEVLGADLINSTTNTLKGAAKSVISSRLTGNDWYLLNASGELKPLVLQKRKAITFESLDKGDRAFMRKELLFGVDYRVGFGYGVWYKAFKIKH
jgi:phage major head subunit gpT-like protein